MDYHMEMNIPFIKVLAAAVLFALLVAAEKKRTKSTLLWILTGYLIYLGVSS